MDINHNATEKKINAGIIFLFLVGLLIGLLLNIPLAITSLKDLREGEVTFEEFVDDVQTEYRSELMFKNNFVSLNGLFARLTGARVLNNIVKMNNGMLDFRSTERINVDDGAKRVAELNQFLSERNISFLYVQAPYKLDLEKKLLPIGITNYVHESVDDFTHQLTENGVEVLDLRTDIGNSPEQVGQYFFATDHHWNALGSFLGFQKIVEYLQMKYPEQQICGEATNLENWELHTYKNWFLGSQGRRVGPYFTGVDDFIYLTPKFETKISCAMPWKNEFLKGDFIEANLHMSFIENGPDYYNLDPYCVYLGGAYPVVQHRNENAFSNLKVLMVGDSFSRPVQTYMSTVFKEIDLIDLRQVNQHFSLANYIQDTQPDMVILMINAPDIGLADHFVYKIDSSYSSQTEMSLITTKDFITLPAEEDTFNSIVLAEGLEPNTEYIINFDDVIVLEGETDGVGISLYDPVKKEVISSQYFDIEYCRENGGFQCIFHAPNQNPDRLLILLYAGIPSRCENISVQYEEVALYRGATQS